MGMANRWGFTVPTGGLVCDPGTGAALTEAGYTDAWSSEVAGSDGFLPLSQLAAETPDLRLGTAIVPVFTRGPALLAQTAATMAAAAPGRFILGIGASSPAIVEAWNGLEYSRPYQRTRDVLRFLRAALGGDKVTAEYETFSVRGFRLAGEVTDPPPIYLAALREGMLRLAGAEADGVIMNWLSAEDVVRCRGIVEDAAEGAAREVVARIFVVPTADSERARAIARWAIAAYMTTPGYAAFQRWLGRTKLLQPMWDAWEAGDRKGALEKIPDEVTDALVVHGDPDACRAHLARYVEAGIDTPVIALLDPEAEPLSTARALSPT
jgi:probable F420-dependent oxidoreductase